MGPASIPVLAVALISALEAAPEQGFGNLAGIVGGGGALTFLVLREVRGMMRERKDNKDGEKLAGEKSVEFWANQYRVSAREALREEIAPQVARQTQILERLAEIINRMDMRDELQHRVKP